MYSAERRVAVDASRTAETNAAERAAERHMPAGRRLLDDPFARHFVRRRGLRALLAAPPLARAGLRAIDRRYPGLHAEILLRGRFVDHLLETRDDVDQVVLMGAGFDSTALRHRDGGPRFFEVDAPTTQAAKREALRAAELEHPGTFVPCDFETERPGRLLAGAGLDPAARTLTVWVGVSYYLTPASFRAALRSVAGCTASGGLLVLDYMDPEVIDGTTRWPGARRAAEWVEKRDEPYLFGLTPQQLERELADAGFALTENLRVPELAARVGPPGGVWCSLDDWMGVALAERRDH